jgi:hypothetical protein
MQARIMASLGAITTWLPWASQRSDALDRLVGIVALAGQCAPLLGRETVARFDDAPPRRSASTEE